MLKGAIHHAKLMGKNVPEQDVFKCFKPPRSTGYRLLRSKSTRRRHNTPTLPETRGRKSVITDEQKKGMDQILQTAGIDGRALTREQLGMKVGSEATGRTIKNIMGSMHYHKCIACQKGWVTEEVAANRLAYARKMLERYVNNLFFIISQPW